MIVEMSAVDVTRFVEVVYDESLHLIGDLEEFDVSDVCEQLLQLWRCVYRRDHLRMPEDHVTTDCGHVAGAVVHGGHGEVASPGMTSQSAGILAQNGQSARRQKIGQGHIAF